MIKFITLTLIIGLIQFSNGGRVYEPVRKYNQNSSCNCYNLQKLSDFCLFKCFTNVKDDQDDYSSSHEYHKNEYFMNDQHSYHYNRHDHSREEWHDSNRQTTNVPTTSSTITTTATKEILTTLSIKEELRQTLIDAETRLRMGGNLIDNFSDDEKFVNQIITSLRANESAIGFTNPGAYPPALHFFKAKPIIDQSQMYKLIRHMPKGAVLHGHNTAMVSSEWVVKNATYRDGLNMCTSKNFVILTFKASDTRCTSPLVSVASQRALATDVNAFDENLRLNFDLWNPRPEIAYPDINTVWGKFQNMFTTVGDFIRYYSVFTDYHYRLLEELWMDNVMYAEIRTSFGELYDEFGNVYNINQTVQILYNIVENFKKTHDNFLGVKFIYAVNRFTTPDLLTKKIKIFNSLFAMYPDFIVGFDLVGQEDLGNPLQTFYSVLNLIPENAKFFFHAGETNWYGTSTDRNVVDAVVLKTHRIGHGFSLMKHPVLWNMLKDSNTRIGIEVSPLSNQILGLVHDLRNHPGVFYVAENLPMVISNDDPGFWSAQGLSYDFYYAFMAFSPYDGGLEIFQQLVQNSIDFSALNDDEKVVAFNMLRQQWDKFYYDLLNGKIL